MFYKSFGGYYSKCAVLGDFTNGFVLKFGQYAYVVLLLLVHTGPGLPPSLCSALPLYNPIILALQLVTFKCRGDGAESRDGMKGTPDSPPTSSSTLFPLISDTPRLSLTRAFSPPSFPFPYGGGRDMLWFLSNAFWGRSQFAIFYR